MRKSWLIAAVIGGAASAAQAADVQLFGIHVPQSKEYAVYAVISNPNSVAPLPGRETVAGLSSIWIEVLNNGGATVATAQNRLPVGTHNDPAATADPGNRYGFWLFQPPAPTVDTAVGALDIRGGQYTQYPPEQAAIYDQYVLQGVGLRSGTKPAGGTVVTETNWSHPVLVAKGTYNGDAAAAGLRLQFHAGAGTNVLKDMDAGPGVNYSGADATPNALRVEGANSTVVDATSFTTGATVAGNTTTKAGMGDANLDGAVGFADLVALSQNYNKKGMSWFQGNFDFDPNGEVNFTDLVLLSQNYNKPIPASGTFSASFEQDLAAAFAQVPEPSALAGVGLAAAGLMGRRRRK